MRMMELTPMLQSSDLPRTIEWYESVLGFRCVGSMEGWCRLERDAAAIMFMANDHLGAPQATATQYIKVDDVMSLWEQLRDAVDPEWGPEEMPYGVMEFAIRDPDGYLLSFGEDLPAPKSETSVSS